MRKNYRAYIKNRKNPSSSSVPKELSENKLKDNTKEDQKKQDIKKPSTIDAISNLAKKLGLCEGSESSQEPKYTDNIDFLTDNSIAGLEQNTIKYTYDLPKKMLNIEMPALTFDTGKNELCLKRLSLTEEASHLPIPLCHIDQSGIYATFYLKMEQLFRTHKLLEGDELDSYKKELINQLHSEAFYLSYLKKKLNENDQTGHKKATKAYYEQSLNQRLEKYYEQLIQLRRNHNLTNWTNIIAPISLFDNKGRKLTHEEKNRISLLLTTAMTLTTSLLDKGDNLTTEQIENIHQEVKAVFESHKEYYNTTNNEEMKNLFDGVQQHIDTIIEEYKEAKTKQQLPEKLENLSVNCHQKIDHLIKELSDIHPKKIEFLNIMNTDIYSSSYLNAYLQNMAHAEHCQKNRQDMIDSFLFTGKIANDGNQLEKMTFYQLFSFTLELAERLRSNRTNEVFLNDLFEFISCIKSSPVLSEKQKEIIDYAQTFHRLAATLDWLKHFSAYIGQKKMQEKKDLFIEIYEHALGDLKKIESSRQKIQGYMKIASEFPNDHNLIDNSFNEMIGTLEEIKSNHSLLAKTKPYVDNDKHKERLQAILAILDNQKKDSTPSQNSTRLNNRSIKNSDAETPITKINLNNLDLNQTNDDNIVNDILNRAASKNKNEVKDDWLHLKAILNRHDIKIQTCLFELQQKAKNNQNLDHEIFSGLLPDDEDFKDYLKNAYNRICNHKEKNYYFWQGLADELNHYLNRRKIKQQKAKPYQSDQPSTIKTLAEVYHGIKNKRNYYKKNNTHYTHINQFIHSNNGLGLQLNDDHNRWQWRPFSAHRFWYRISAYHMKGLELESQEIGEKTVFNLHKYDSHQRPFISAFYKQISGTNIWNETGLNSYFAPCVAYEQLGWLRPLLKWLGLGSHQKKTTAKGVSYSWSSYENGQDPLWVEQHKYFETAIGKLGITNPISAETLKNALDFTSRQSDMIGKINLTATLFKFITDLANILKSDKDLENIEKKINTLTWAIDDLKKVFCNNSAQDQNFYGLLDQTEKLLEELSIHHQLQQQKKTVHNTFKDINKTTNIFNQKLLRLLTEESAFGTRSNVIPDKATTKADVDKNSYELLLKKQDIYNNSENNIAIQIYKNYNENADKTQWIENISQQKNLFDSSIASPRQTVVLRALILQELVKTHCQLIASNGEHWLMIDQGHDLSQALIDQIQVDYENIADTLGKLGTNKSLDGLKKSLKVELNRVNYLNDAAKEKLKHRGNQRRSEHHRTFKQLCLIYQQLDNSVNKSNNSGALDTVLAEITALEESINNGSLIADKPEAQHKAILDVASRHVNSKERKNFYHYYHQWIDTLPPAVIVYFYLKDDKKINQSNLKESLRKLYGGQLDEKLSALLDDVELSEDNIDNINTRIKRNVEFIASGGKQEPNLYSSTTISSWQSQSTTTVNESSDDAEPTCPQQIGSLAT